MPKVSVIIPTYNRRELLREAIASVQKQTLDDFELLIIDDGSTDGTADAVKAINDPRIRYYYKENGGVSSARNIGLQMAIGDYIGFLDSDDLFLPDYLRTMVSALETHPDHGVVYTNLLDYYPDGRVDDMNRRGHSCSGWITKEIFSNFFVACQASLIRSQLVKSIFFDEELELAEDRDFFLRLSILTQIFYVPQLQVIRRPQQDSLSRENGVGRVHMDNTKVLERFYFELGGDKWISKRHAFNYLSKQYRRMGVKLFRRGDIHASLCLYRTSLRYNKINLSAMRGVIRCLLKRPIKAIESVEKAV
jgi:glycosyltransferase involved in cell wall biosynthesis